MGLKGSLTLIEELLYTQEKYKLNDLCISFTTKLVEVSIKEQTKGHTDEFMEGSL